MRRLADTDSTVPVTLRSYITTASHAGAAACVLTGADLHPSLTAVCGIVLTRGMTEANISDKTACLTVRYSIHVLRVSPEYG